MVKFKWSCLSGCRFASAIYIPIWLNSNDILIDLIGSMLDLHSNMVKFKYLLEQVTAFSFFIYIPIWLNSNVFRRKLPDMLLQHLHSNMVKFK